MSAQGPHLDLTEATDYQLAKWLCDAADNVETTWKRTHVGHLAGWEDRLMRKAAERMNLRASVTVRCQHEAYQGRCVHCDAPFKGGLPVISAGPA